MDFSVCSVVYQACRKQHLVSGDGILQPHVSSYHVTSIVMTLAGTCFHAIRNCSSKLQIKLGDAGRRWHGNRLDTEQETILPKLLPTSLHFHIQRLSLNQNVLSIAGHGLNQRAKDEIMNPLRVRVFWC